MNENYAQLFIINCNLIAQENCLEKVICGWRQRQFGIKSVAIRKSQHFCLFSWMNSSLFAFAFEMGIILLFCFLFFLYWKWIFLVIFFIVSWHNRFPQSYFMVLCVNGLLFVVTGWWYFMGFLTDFFLIALGFFIVVLVREYMWESRA
jgi:hypothetical protein